MGSSKIRTLFKRKSNHFNIYSHTIGGFGERSVPCNCPNCWRIGYCECGFIVLTGNCISHTRTTWEVYVSYKMPYQISHLNSKISDQLSSEPRVPRNKTINMNFKFTSTSIPQAGICLLTTFLN